MSHGDFQSFVFNYQYDDKQTYVKSNSKQKS